LNLFFSILLAAFLLSLLLVYEKRRRRISGWSPRRSSPCLFVAVAFFQASPVPSYGNFVLWAWFFAWQGCMPALAGDKPFRAGLAAFLAGHAFYMVGFAQT